MLDFLFFKVLEIHINNFLAETFVILMTYFFVKMLILTSLMELIWPTQFFNRRHSMGVNSYRLRTYTETIMKLYTNHFSFNKIFIKSI